MEKLLLDSTAILPTYLKLLFKSVSVFQIRTVTGSLSFEVKLQVRVQQYMDYYYKIRWSGLFYTAVVECLLLPSCFKSH